MTGYRSTEPAGRTGGPCDEHCGCVSAEAAAPAERTMQLRSPGPATPPPIELIEIDDAQPISCTLDGADQQYRAREWRQLLQAATGRQDVGDGIRLTLPADPDLIGKAARLAVLEQACCRFFMFAIELAGESVTLTVRAPAGAAELLHDMFGSRS